MLRAPSLAALALLVCAFVAQPAQGAQRYDLAVVGTGPVALLAALRAKRANPSLRVVMLEKREGKRAHRANLLNLVGESVNLLREAGVDLGNSIGGRVTRFGDFEPGPADLERGRTLAQKPSFAATRSGRNARA